jgi:hypothetical protein
LRAQTRRYSNQNSAGFSPSLSIAEDYEQKAFAAIVQEDADATGVADAIVKIVDMPFGKRPFRVHHIPRKTGPTWALQCSTGSAPRCSSA